eukprot:COSAG01_NODE_48803_length_377_cov_13.784173_1_plen_32_part_01
MAGPPGAGAPARVSSEAGTPREDAQHSRGRPT